MVNTRNLFLSSPMSTNAEVYFDNYLYSLFNLLSQSRSKSKQVLVLTWMTGLFLTRFLMFNLDQIFTVDLNNQDKLFEVKVGHFDPN